MERVQDRLLEGDLVESDARLAGQYKECAEQVRGWIRWEAGRVEEDQPKPTLRERIFGR